MKVHSDIDGLSFSSMKAIMRHRAKEYELTVVEDGPETLMIETNFGQFGVAYRAPDGRRLIISAAKTDDIHVIRDALVGQIASAVPEFADKIIWSDTAAQGQYPPNLQFSEVIASEQLSADFRRVKLRLDQPEAIAGDDAIHFRILLPEAENTDPDYPILLPNGSTKWPKGNKALHRPVYTARRMVGDIVDMAFNMTGAARLTGRGRFPRAQDLPSSGPAVAVWWTVGPSFWPGMKRPIPRSPGSWKPCLTM